MGTGVQTTDTHTILHAVGCIDYTIVGNRLTKAEAEAEATTHGGRRGCPISRAAPVPTPRASLLFLNTRFMFINGHLLYYRSVSRTLPSAGLGRGPST